MISQKVVSMSLEVLRMISELSQSIPNLPSQQTQVLNEQIAQMTWISYLVILVPSLICMGFMFWHLFSGIKKMTGLKMEDVVHNIKKAEPVDTVISVNEIDKIGKSE